MNPGGLAKVQTKLTESPGLGPHPQNTTHLTRPPQRWAPLLLGHEAQDGEDGKPGHEAGAAVEEAERDAVPVGGAGQGTEVSGAPSASGRDQEPKGHLLPSRGRGHPRGWS